MKITNDFLFLSYISVQKKHSKNFKFAEKQKKYFNGRLFIGWPATHFFTGRFASIVLDGFKLLRISGNIK